MREHEIRIIGGRYKRSTLPVPSHPGLRPTPHRVRETLFNWLGQNLPGCRCLDAFAGTGALGFEAASRDATAVHLVERDATLVAQLERTQKRLQVPAVRVTLGDGVVALRHIASHSLEVVFLDPPFDSDLLEAALPHASQAVTPTGFVYLESRTPWGNDRLRAFDLQLCRYLKAGAVHAHLLQRLAMR